MIEAILLAIYIICAALPLLLIFKTLKGADKSDNGSDFAKKEQEEFDKRILEKLPEYRKYAKVKLPAFIGFISLANIMSHWYDLSQRPGDTFALVFLYLGIGGLFLAIGAGIVGNRKEVTNQILIKEGNPRD